MGEKKKSKSSSSTKEIKKNDDKLDTRGSEIPHKKRKLEENSLQEEKITKKVKKLHKEEEKSVTETRKERKDKKKTKKDQSNEVKTKCFSTTNDLEGTDIVEKEKEKGHSKKKSNVKDDHNQTGTTANDVETLNDKDKRKRKKKEPKKPTEKESITFLTENGEIKKGKEEGDNDDQDSAAHQALLYLKTWKKNRSEWTFKKVRQVWLLKNMFNQTKVPDKKFMVLLQYLEGLKGSSRDTTISKAETIINNETGTDDESHARLERARKLLQILS